MSRDFWMVIVELLYWMLMLLVTTKLGVWTYLIYPNTLPFRFCRGYGNRSRNSLEYFDAEKLSLRLDRETEDLSWRRIVGGPTFHDTNDIPCLPETTQDYLHNYQLEYHDMCFAYEDRVKIFSVRYMSDNTNVTAYSEKVLWSMSKFKPDGMRYPMYPSGITTDGHGHLFICDGANQCIQIFDTDGTYLCPVDCNGKLELGTPQQIDWSQTDSALVVTHIVNNKCFISVLKIQIHSNSSSL